MKLPAGRAVLEYIEALYEETTPVVDFRERSQVEKMKADGSPEVAFRVAIRDGKVNFTARGLKGAQDDESTHHGQGR